MAPFLIVSPRNANSFLFKLTAMAVYEHSALTQIKLNHIIPIGFL